jgi:hypothetical protein
MRLALLTALVLCGCSTAPEKIPLQPNAPTSESIVATVGKEWDTADQKVAASVTIVRENADKPEVVKAETGVALSFLPPPNEGELALARQRAAKSDQKDYATAVDFGKKLLAKIDSNWAKVQADQKESARISKLKDDRIAALTAEVERVKQDAAANIWTMTGAGLVVIGGLVCAFVSRKAGIPIIACGAFAGSLPFFFDSPYFSIIAGVSLASIAGLGIWWIYDRVKDSVNKYDGKDR